jgi:hypothetical protein
MFAMRTNGGKKKIQKEEKHQLHATLFMLFYSKICQACTEPSIRTPRISKQSHGTQQCQCSLKYLQSLRKQHKHRGFLQALQTLELARHVQVLAAHPPREKHHRQQGQHQPGSKPSTSTHKGGRQIQQMRERRIRRVRCNRNRNIKRLTEDCSKHDGTTSTNDS